MNYALISTYPVAGRGPKRQNLGDGFILEATKRAFDHQQCIYTKSYWEPLTPFDIAVFNQCDYVVVAAANQLSPNFALTRGTPAKQLESIKTPIILFGAGVHGEYPLSTPLTTNACETLVQVIERSGRSGWRCRRSISYLASQLPSSIAKNLAYTCCPVLTHGGIRNVVKPLGHPGALRRILFTVTDRGASIGCELPAFRHVRTACPDAELTVVLHQDLAGHGGIVDGFKRTRFLTALRRLDCQLAYLSDPAAAIAMYSAFDAHIGSRLHAHLLSLSHGVPSLLIPVDGRSTGFAADLRFLPWSPARGDTLTQLLSQPWSGISDAINQAREAMDGFLRPFAISSRS